MKDDALIDLEKRLLNKEIKYFSQAELSKDHKHLLKSLKKGWKFYSLILYQEYEISPTHYKNKNLFKTTKENWVSELDEEFNSYLHTNNNKLTEEIENLLLKKKISRQKDVKLFYEAFDKELEKRKEPKLKELLEDLVTKHTYYYLLDEKGLEKKPEESHDKEVEKFLSNHPEFKDKMIKKLTKPRVFYKKERIYSEHFPNPLDSMLELEPWIQVFFLEKDGQVFYQRGKYSGSGGRHSQGFFGHLFAELQSQGNKIETYIAKIDYECQIQAFKEEELVLHNNSLIHGNYSYDIKKSKNIFSKIKLIEDPMSLSWDYFLKTGKQWKNYRKKDKNEAKK